MKSKIIPSTVSSKWLFGDDFVDNIRDIINIYDEDFFPDSIIKAELHTNIVKAFMSEAIKEELSGKSIFPNKSEFQRVAICYLISSIYHALASRAKEDKFSYKFDSESLYESHKKALAFSNLIYSHYYAPILKKEITMSQAFKNAVKSEN